MKRIMECVPNFSEGRNMDVINTIVSAIAYEGVKVLNVDSGEAANRSVVTFAGDPDAVIEAAFQGVKTAGELIDMRLHHGVHPRSGATDVLPFVPVSGVTLDECVEMTRKLAKRIYEELGIPCYCYEAAAYRPERKNLAVCRAGEYEALSEKISDADRRPDFGPETFTEKAAYSGATNIGARDFLIAVNFNLDTTSVEMANEIACDVREKGRPQKPGTLKGCKAIGWFIEEYGIAQVSMNITDINAAPLHVVYEEVSRAAGARGVNVTGTEIIGLVPRRSLLEAGQYFIEKYQPASDVSEETLMLTAVKFMGLDDLRPFDPYDKVIEYLI